MSQQNKQSGHKVVAFTFGRFNPPTIGHELLINKVKQFAAKNDYYIFPSHSVDKKKNPLTAAQKITLMKEMFPSHKDNIILDESIRDAIKALKWLEDKGYTDAIFVVGSDRVPAFQFIKKYNGKDYNMNTIEIESAGERDPDADDVSGMSASKVRKAIVDGDFDLVEKALPNSVKNNNKFKKNYIQSVLGGMS